MSISETSAARRTGVSGGARPAVVAAAVGSAVAGLVHAAAAGTHQGDSLLVWMFSACAAQLGWVGRWRLRRALDDTSHRSCDQWRAVLVWAAPRRSASASSTRSRSLRKLERRIHGGAVRSAERGGHRVPPRTSSGAGRVSSVVGRSRRGGQCLLAMPALAAGHSHSSTAHDHVTTGDETAASHSHGEATEADAHATPRTRRRPPRTRAHTADTTSTSATRTLTPRIRRRPRRQRTRTIATPSPPRRPPTTTRRESATTDTELGSAARPLDDHDAAP